MSLVNVGFEIKMQKRFLDKEIASRLNKKIRTAMAVSGSAVMTTARRLFKKKASIPIRAMDPIQYERYSLQMKQYRKGLRSEKPRKPDKVSKPGEYPRLHSERSLLKYRLFFALSDDMKSVVVGPEYFPTHTYSGYGLRDVKELEEKRPFMVPAFNKVTPRIPGYIRKVINRST